MTTHRLAKDLLGDAEVADWYANLKEGSELTADVYLRRLNRFCEEFGTTPQALAAMNSKDAYKLLLNAVRGFRSRGLAGSSISVYIKTLRKWFLHNDIVISAFLYGIARMDSEQYRRRFSQCAFGLMMLAAFLVSVGLVPQIIGGQIPGEDRTLLVFGAPFVYLVAGFIVTAWFCHSKL